MVARAGILVFASHSEALVRRLCSKAILVDQGSVVVTGSIDEVLARYGQAALANEVAEIRASTSWRVTAPLRWARRLPGTSAEEAGWRRAVREGLTLRYKDVVLPVESALLKAQHCVFLRREVSCSAWCRHPT